MTNGLYFPSPDHELEILQSMLGLDHPCIPPLGDVIFVSLDTEPKKGPNKNHPTNPINGIREVGVSMLDTRGLSLSIPTSRLITRHFVAGGVNKIRKAARKFHFGASEHLDHEDDLVHEAIFHLLHIPDDQEALTKRKFRNIALVGHGLHSDLTILRKRGMSLENISTIVARFDTTSIGKSVLGTGFRLPLLLQTLSCPNKHVHSAGNDANFTLRALLVLVYHGLKEDVTSPDAIRTLKYLKNLGVEPLPETRTRNKLAQAALDALIQPQYSEDAFFAVSDMGTTIFDEV